MNRLARFAWIVVAYNLVVIAWGAYVRASDSGNGCGAHWPLCNGEVVPRAPELATLVEAVDRAATGTAPSAARKSVAWVAASVRFVPSRPGSTRNTDHIV